MTSRRTFLTLLGTGLVIAGAAGSWALTRDPAAARRPWTEAGQGDDIRLRALSYAILAPNPHNRQPWIADLSTPDQITLYCQQDRRLPQTDPFDRQITIGLGAFIELLVMAAAANGHDANVTLFPEGEPMPRLDNRAVATIRFTANPAAKADPLFAHVLKRHTNRSAFDLARPVSADDLATLAAAARTDVKVGATVNPEQVVHLRDRAWQAMVTEMTTKRTALESIELTRIGKAEIEANPDGISLAGPMLEGLSLAGLLPREAMLDPSSSTYRQMEASLKVPFDTAMAFLWTSTPGNRRSDQIAAGRAHVRIHLAATGLGLGLQPMSQALQEFPEMAEHFAAIRSDLGMAGDETLQMFVRLGYGAAMPASPRWPLSNRIRT